MATYLHLDNQIAALLLDCTLDPFDSIFESFRGEILKGISSVSCQPLAIAPPAMESNLTLSVAFVDITYKGGATSLALMGTASVLTASPARRARLIASIPAGV